jgi:hypothetical protein
MKIINKTFGLLKMILGTVFLLSIFITTSKMNSNSMHDLVSSILAILLALGYGYSLFTNGLADFRNVKFRKLFLKIEFIIGLFLFFMLTLIVLINKQIFSVYFPFVIVDLIILSFSIRCILILKNNNRVI